MAAPKYVGLAAEFDEWFPQGLYPARPHMDEATGLPLFRGTFADSAAEKDREKSVTVEFAANVQPVPPAAMPGVSFRPVVLEGMTVQPRAEVSGQTKWITWVGRATGMAAPMAGESGARQADTSKAA